MPTKKSLSKSSDRSPSGDSKSRLGNRSFKTEPQKVAARNRNFRTLEDAQNLSPLAALVTASTEKAYREAVKISNSIVHVEDGKVIRRTKNGSIEVITQLQPSRKVEVGKKIDISK